MVEIKKSPFGVTYSYVWLAGRPSLTSAFRAVAYNKCACTDPVAGFVRKRKFAQIIDLSQPAEALLGDMSKNTAYEIRRARRDGVRLRTVDDVDAFSAFYNAFARSKQRTTISSDELRHMRWGTETVGLAASQNGRDLAMHGYVVDAPSKRVCHLYAATHFRHAADNAERRAISRANRFLHYESMLYFKGRGILTCDLGDVTPGTEDEELLKIYQYKKEFGGRMAEHVEYYSYPMYFMTLANHLIGFL